MLIQLLLGTGVIAATIVVEVLFMAVAEIAMKSRAAWLARSPHLWRTVVALVGVTLWLMLAHAIGVWLWALTFLWLEIFGALEPAVYFSVVAFTTLGFGDVLVGTEWRLLSGLAAANGLLIFGLSTAMLVEALRQIRLAQGRNLG